MDLLNKYANSDSDDVQSDNDHNQKQAGVEEVKEQVGKPIQLLQSASIQLSQLAPDVDTSVMEFKQNQQELTRFQRETKLETKQNHLTGFLQEAQLDPSKFYEQFHSFENKGIALNPTDGAGITSSMFVGSGKRQRTSITDPHASFETPEPSEAVEKSKKAKRREMKMQRQKFGDACSGDFKGPWATYDGMDEFKNQTTDLTEEQKDLMKKFEEKRQQRLNDAQTQDMKSGVPGEGKTTTIYHGNGNHGLMSSSASGRSFVDAPSYLRNKEHDCFIPKKWIHTWQGHDRGVQRIKFFPRTGHLILSASHDGTCKIWDVMTHRKCIRTYMGHHKAVRDTCFTNDGRKFLSAGFDKVVNLWDTETGKIIRSFSNKKTPFCVKFHPAEDKQNIFLAGCSNKKIIQYDINAKDSIQQYEEHLGSIDTITFIENGRRFVSTADDKKIYVWEFGIPVVAKHISEPDMHAIPATTMHPNMKYFAGQSMDNNIVIYDCKGNFKINRKKKFSGHLSSGYACGLKFSPDGQFLCSGDADGKLWFWNWKTCKNYRTINVHDEGNVCIDVDWHPIEPSKVATCSWDGTIKLWD